MLVGRPRGVQHSFSKPSKGAADVDATGDDEAKPTKTRGTPGEKRVAASNEQPAGKATKAAKREWPKGREAQAKAVLAALRDCDGSVTAGELAKQFSRAHRETIDELLQALATLGQARQLRGGKYTS
jgi:hypothetical protein